MNSPNKFPLTGADDSVLDILVSKSIEPGDTSKTWALIKQHLDAIDDENKRFKAQTAVMNKLTQINADFNAKMRETARTAFEYIKDKGDLANSNLSEAEFLGHFGELGKQLAAKKRDRASTSYSRMEKVLTTLRGEAFIKYVRTQEGLTAGGNLCILAAVVEKLKDPKEIIRHLNKGMIVRLGDKGRGKSTKLITMAADVNWSKDTIAKGITFEDPTDDEISHAGLMKGELGQLVEQRLPKPALVQFTDESSESESIITPAHPKGLLKRKAAGGSAGDAPKSKKPVSHGPAKKFKVEESSDDERKTKMVVRMNEMIMAELYNRLG